MNATAPFNRLLWKERRVLRNVWLMCGIGVTFLMLLILAIGESTSHSQGYSASFWIFMVWIPPVYVLAALATMFAGEREEGTLVWLTTLSPRLTTVVSSRLLFVLASGIALQAWYGLSALLLSQFDEPIGASPTDSAENLVIMSFLLVEALAYGMFWSLQTNRPLNAILYAAITIILVNSGAAMLTEAMGGRVTVLPNDAAGYALGFWGWARCLLVLGVMVVNGKLAGRWLDGRPWDWEWAAAWWSRRRMKTLPGTSGVAVLPAEASEPWRRAWQRLRWLEWQSLRSFAWIVLGMTLLSCFSIHFWVNGRPTFGFSFVICWLVLIIGGLMSWHGEQAQQRFRALVRLGISPLALWANKLACWLTATLLAMVMIQGPTALWWIVIGVFENQSAAGRHAPLRELWMESSVVPNAGAIISLMAMYSLTLFALGFACSHLLRKTVLSLGVTLIGAALFSSWFALCGQFELPWSLFFAPIPMWLLWISANALPAWWTEQTTWRVSYRRMGVLALQAVFPIGLLTLAAGYRVWEVPTVRASAPADHGSSGLSSAASRSGSPITSDPQWNRLVIVLNQPLAFPADGQQVEAPSAQAAPAENPDLPHAELRRVDSVSRRELVQANQKTLDEIVTLTFALTSVSSDPRMIPAQLSWRFLPLLVQAAQFQLEDGHPDQSLQFVQAAARLSGLLLQFSPLTLRIEAIHPEYSQVQAEMVRWAQHPRQTEETLSRGSQLCAGELRYWQTQPEELYVYRTSERELTESISSYFFWERMRAEKLIDVAYSNRTVYLAVCKTGWMRPGYFHRNHPDTTHFHVSRDPVRRLAWTFEPAEQRHWQTSSVYGLSNDIIIAMHKRENDYRATLALMAIVGHRRIHGSLPVSLFDLSSDWISSTSTDDVWTRTAFGYAPTGLPVTEPNFAPTSRYRQPLIWTGGPTHSLLSVRGNEIQLVDEVRGNIMLTHIVRNDASTPISREFGDSWVFPIPPQDEEDSAPARP